MHFASKSLTASWDANLSQADSFSKLDSIKLIGRLSSIELLNRVRSASSLSLDFAVERLAKLLEDEYQP